MTEADPKAGHRIEVNEYGDDVKSLGFKTPEGSDATIGVINPGKPQAFTTDRQEMITILSGRLQVFIEGDVGPVIHQPGPSFVLPAKSRVTFLALDDQQVAYKCVYIPHEKRPAVGEPEAVVDTSTTARAAAQALGPTSSAPGEVKGVFDPTYVG